MSDLVRVRIVSSGHHATVTAAEAEFNNSAYVVLRSPAVDANGRPLPPKFRVPKGVQEPAESAGEVTTTATTATTEATKEAKP